jgi:hypothetical protein
MLKHVYQQNDSNSFLNLIFLDFIELVNLFFLNVSGSCIISKCPNFIFDCQAQLNKHFTY